MEKDKRLKAFIDAPWLGIGVGMVIGAFGSLLSAKWLVGVGWVIICCELFRHDLFEKGPLIRNVGNLIISVLLGFSCVGIWTLTPKPETPVTRKDVRELLNESRQNNVSTSATRTTSVQKDNDSKPVTKAELRAMLQQFNPLIPKEIRVVEIPKESLQAVAVAIVDQMQILASQWDRDDNDIDRKLIRQLDRLMPSATQEINAVRKASGLERVALDRKYSRQLLPLMKNAETIREELLDGQPKNEEDKKNDVIIAKVLAGGASNWVEMNEVAHYMHDLVKTFFPSSVFAQHR